jgi:hypothetical protein
VSGPDGTIGGKASPSAPSRVLTYCAAAAISYSYIPGRVARIASAVASAPSFPLWRRRSIS